MNNNLTLGKKYANTETQNHERIERWLHKQRAFASRMTKMIHHEDQSYLADDAVDLAELLPRRLFVDPAIVDDEEKSKISNQYNLVALSSNKNPRNSDLSYCQ